MKVICCVKQNKFNVSILPYVFKRHDRYYLNNQRIYLFSSYLDDLKENVVVLDTISTRSYVIHKEDIIKIDKLSTMLKIIKKCKIRKSKWKI